MNPFLQLAVDGVNQAPFSREWYAGASRRDQTLVTLRNGLANWGGRYPDRFNTQASMSYVTGSHNAKFGYDGGYFAQTRRNTAGNTRRQRGPVGRVAQASGLKHSGLMQVRRRLCTLRTLRAGPRAARGR